MKTIALIIMVAIVLEALVEYGKTIDKMVVSKDYKTAITQGITILLGIGLAFTFNLQLFNNALSEFYEGIAINPTIDIILTGILFSRGSNFFSDFIARIRNPKMVEYQGSEFIDLDEFALDDEDEDDEEEEEPEVEAPEEAEAEA